MIILKEEFNLDIDFMAPSKDALEKFMVADEIEFDESYVVAIGDRRNQKFYRITTEGWFPNSIFTQEVIEIKGGYKITETRDWKLCMVRLDNTPCILFLRQSMKLHMSPADRWETIIALVPLNTDDKTKRELYYRYSVKVSTSKVSTFISKAEGIMY